MNALDLIAGRGQGPWRKDVVSGRRPPVRHEKPPTVSAAPSCLVARALAEGSNLALDWMWYAGQPTDVAERAYCLARAQWITPSEGQHADGRAPRTGHQTDGRLEVPATRV